MSGLIAADALCEYANNTKDKTVDANDIMRFPTVDAVKVVRCKDCKYYDEKDHNCLDEMAYARCWMPTDFCSFGERRK